MSPERIVAIVGAVVAVSGVLLLLMKRLPKRVQKGAYTKKWRDIQRLCVTRSNWPQAILLADMLLDEVLRKKRKNGKSMGERLVAAQKDIANNDATWQAHKLANHLRHAPETSVPESEVKAALIAFRQALRDLGAL